MFCARCGQQIPEASEICPLCGREANIQLPPPSSPVGAVAGIAPAPDYIPGLKGVGGWLLFFCIITTILTPLMNLPGFARLAEIRSPWAFYDLAVIVFSMIVGVSVWRVSPDAIPLLRAYFVTFVIWEALRISTVVIVMHNSTFDLPMMYRIRTLIWCLVWGAYFHRSQRVRATFGRNL
jgi:hypothetical protein